jgi:hypothetical protein
MFDALRGLPPIITVGRTMVDAMGPSRDTEDRPAGPTLYLETTTLDPSSRGGRRSVGSL